MLELGVYALSSEFCSLWAVGQNTLLCGSAGARGNLPVGRTSRRGGAEAAPAAGFTRGVSTTTANPNLFLRDKGVVS